MDIRVHNPRFQETFKVNYEQLTVSHQDTEDRKLLIIAFSCQRPIMFVL